MNITIPSKGPFTLLFVALFVVAMYMLVTDGSRPSKGWPLTPGTVTEVERGVAIDILRQVTGAKKLCRKVAYTYEVNGTRYTGAHRWPREDCDQRGPPDKPVYPGDALLISYNPAKPAESHIAEHTPKPTHP
jgi:hypothetical protein